MRCGSSATTWHMEYESYELHQVVRVLEQMVRAYALELLGCPSGVINRVLETS